MSSMKDVSIRQNATLKELVSEIRSLLKKEDWIYQKFGEGLEINSELAELENKKKEWAAKVDRLAAQDFTE